MVYPKAGNGLLKWSALYLFVVFPSFFLDFSLNSLAVNVSHNLSKASVANPDTQNDFPVVLGAKHAFQNNIEKHKEKSRFLQILARGRSWELLARS